MILSNNITIIDSVNKLKEYYNQSLLLDYLFFEPVHTYIYIYIQIYLYNILYIHVLRVNTLTN